MRSVPGAAVVGSAIAALTVGPAAAQAPSIPANPQIEIAYREPTNPDFAPIYERLKNRRVLETLQQFLAPLKLDRKLTIKIDQCGTTSIPYKPQGPITICYEYIQQIERMAPRSTVALVQGQVTTEGAIVGPVVQAALHEVAIATFDMLDTPIWGRLDDAADRVSAFVMLQFGPTVAWNTIVGTAWFLSGNATSTPDYSDVRGAVAQRYYTTLCIAYGGEQRGVFKVTDPRTSSAAGFANFVGNDAAGSLPAERARGCANEFDLIQQGFAQTILPKLDKPLLEQVQAANWISFAGTR
jgi:hypothetical protein